MTLDLSKAKVGDKVRHRNGGCSVITDVSDNKVYTGFSLSGLAFDKLTGEAFVLYDDSDCRIIELIAQENELDKYAQELAHKIYLDVSPIALTEALLNFANAIVKAARE